MRIFNLTILLFLVAFSVYSQDRIKVVGGVSLGVVPVFLSGTTDVGDGGGTFKGSRHIITNPVYRHVDTTGIVGNMAFYFGLNFPFYKNDNWSTGIKLNAGFGYQGSLKAAEGLESLTLNFPQYIYWRHYKRFDYSILAGYKYTYSSLPYHLMILGIDINSGFEKGDVTFRLYGSPFSYNYYTLYTNGQLKEAIKIYELGLAVDIYF